MGPIRCPGCCAGSRALGGGLRGDRHPCNTAHGGPRYGGTGAGIHIVDAAAAQLATGVAGGHDRVMGTRRRWRCSYIRIAWRAGWQCLVPDEDQMDILSRPAIAYGKGKPVGGCPYAPLRRS